MFNLHRLAEVLLQARALSPRLTLIVAGDAVGKRHTPLALVEPVEASASGLRKAAGVEWQVGGPGMKPGLTLQNLKDEAKKFARLEHKELELYGVTDGKAIDTYFERKFRSYLRWLILANPPEIGYLTISNALQWRLQCSRIIETAGSVPGIERLI